MSGDAAPRPPGLLRRTLRAPLLSPAGFLVRAAIIALVYLAAHLAGLRAHTSFLSGTAPASGGFERAPLVLGIAYALLHFAFVILVPVLVLAAGLMALWSRMSSRRSTGG